MVWLMISTIITEKLHPVHQRASISSTAYGSIFRCWPMRWCGGNLVAFSAQPPGLCAGRSAVRDQAHQRRHPAGDPRLVSWSPVNAVWVALLLGMACVRFRDVQQLVTTVLQISLFVTPIFWPPRALEWRDPDDLRRLQSAVLLHRCRPLAAAGQGCRRRQATSSSWRSWWSAGPRRSCCLRASVNASRSGFEQWPASSPRMWCSTFRSTECSAAFAGHYSSGPRAGLIHKKDATHSHLGVTALAGVSFELNDGDRLGLIGHNGAGKIVAAEGAGRRLSAHLRRGSGVEGKITSLFEINSGIDTEDTGYETIITIGMLLGLSRREIESKVPEIEAFQRARRIPVAADSHLLDRGWRHGWAFRSPRSWSLKSSCSTRALAPATRGSPRARGGAVGRAGPPQRNSGIGQPHRRIDSPYLQQGGAARIRTDCPNR